MNDREEVKAFLKEIEVLNFRFDLQEIFFSAVNRIVIAMRVENNAVTGLPYDDPDMALRSAFEFDFPTDEETLLRTIKYQCHMMITHEFDEQFRLRGERIFDPHKITFVPSDKEFSGNARD